jgi:hypothetical protein
VRRLAITRGKQPLPNPHLRKTYIVSVYWRDGCVVRWDYKNYSEAYAHVGEECESLEVIYCMVTTAYSDVRVANELMYYCLSKYGDGIFQTSTLVKLREHLGKRGVKLP